MVLVKFAIVFTAIGCQLAQALLPIHIKGKRFIRPASPDNDPEQNRAFFVTGVAYQPGGSSGYSSRSGEDLLTDEHVCAREAAVLQQLGVNTIRIYSLNPDLNHDKCMTIFNNAGIYLILDVNSGEEGESLNRAKPSDSYNARYMSRVFRFIDAFKGYPNVLGFFSGNEVINDQANYAKSVPPYLRAVQRDMKQYIAKHADRPIPVGYAAADVNELRQPTVGYLQCNSRDGRNVDEALDESRSDFFGLNTYEWCSGMTFSSSGYERLGSTFKDAVIPLFFSEYGCTRRGRTFDEVTEGLYSKLSDTFSGGLVYEYSMEASGYGLVDVVSNGDIKYRSDFATLKDKFSQISLPDISEASVTNNTIFECSPEKLNAASTGFGASNFSIPSQPTDIARMISNGVKGGNVGSILSDYTPPSSIKYNVYDENDNPVSVSVSYDPKNLQNKLGTTMAVPSTVASSSSSKSSTNDAVVPTSFIGGIGVLLLSTLSALL